MDEIDDWLNQAQIDERHATLDSAEFDIDDNILIND